MHALTLIAACTAASAAAGALTSLLLQVAPPPQVTTPVAPATPRLAEAVADLQARIGEIESARQLPAVRSHVPATGSAVAPSNADDPSAEALASAAPAPTGATGSVDLAAVLDQLEELDMTGPEARALWEAAHGRGELHELLAAMEARHANLPETAENHLERARAYQSAARVHPGNQDGNWWVESNDAYSAALDLDPEHWDARYEKARNLSFWPAAYGGQGEAIRHFEILVEQQRNQPARKEFAGTYRWLGNLYDQQGRTEQARATWQAGLALFPDNRTLAGKLESLR